MKKTAILFPGQGSQYVGMGQELMAADKKASELVSLANFTVGRDLDRLIKEGPLEELTQTRWVQPAITLVNLLCWQELQKRLPERWKRLCFSVLYRGRVIRIEMEKGITAFRLEEGEPLKLSIYNSEYTLTADGLSVPRA